MAHTAALAIIIARSIVSNAKVMEKVNVIEKHVIHS